jgi:hypothetical protein
MWNLILSICGFVLALPGRVWQANWAFMRNWWNARYHGG